MENNSKIEKYTNDDLQDIYEIINDAAVAYKNVIPNDCYHEPYMSMAELKSQIEGGVNFYCLKHNQTIIGIMGIQEKTDVTLIRHAYVRTASRTQGIGSKLLNHLKSLTTKTILIGTWVDAVWAISFYKKNGFTLLSTEIKNELLTKYWNISDRQRETSVVLSNHLEGFNYATLLKEQKPC